MGVFHDVGRFDRRSALALHASAHASHAGGIVTVRGCGTELTHAGCSTGCCTLQHGASAARGGWDQPPVGGSALWLAGAQVDVVGRAACGGSASRADACLSLPSRRRRIRAVARVARPHRAGDRGAAALACRGHRAAQHRHRPTRTRARAARAGGGEGRRRQRGGEARGGGGGAGEVVRPSCELGRPGDVCRDAATRRRHPLHHAERAREAPQRVLSERARNLALLAGRAGNDHDFDARQDRMLHWLLSHRHGAHPRCYRHVVPQPLRFRRHSAAGDGQRRNLAGARLQCLQCANRARAPLAPPDRRRTVPVRSRRGRARPRLVRRLLHAVGPLNVVPSRCGRQPAARVAGVALWNHRLLSRVHPRPGCGRVCVRRAPHQSTGDVLLRVLHSLRGVPSARAERHGSHALFVGQHLHLSRSARRLSQKSASPVDSMDAHAGCDRQ
mmetsp:Transcript_52318/g.154420  ORF Transcript_52318/g.154420 Transcript_52318/m.154420 type:complete len:444 (-) Transcript_52318:9-1340(-)